MLEKTLNTTSTEMPMIGTQSMSIQLMDRVANTWFAVSVKPEN